MKNNSWKTNYFADFQENSYLLLSSLQDRTTEYIMNYINPVYTNVCNVIKLLCYIIFLSTPKFIKRYFAVRLSEKICKDFSFFVYEVYLRHTSPTEPVSSKHIKYI